MPLRHITPMKVSILIVVFAIGALTAAYAQRKKTHKSTPANPAPNTQAEWKTAASTDGVVIEFSPKRLARISPAVVRVWTRRHYLGEKFDGFIMYLNEYNCRTRVFRSLKTVMYDKSGKMLITTFTMELYETPKADWESVIPNTLGEEELDHICTYRK